MASPPLDSATLPGIGGKIKQQPEDFEVEEVPAYEPSGAGTFLYLWIEKRDLGAEFFVREIARRLDLDTGEIGMAGLKDRRAVARQWVSVPETAETNLARLEGAGMRLLQVSRHTNKLRTGHLRGNRFNILVRDAVPEAAALLAPLLARLGQQGFPNFYGPQRFGRNGETAVLGLDLLQNKQAAARRPGPFLRKLALSAAQSLLFNRWLSQRMQDGLLRQVIAGDVMAKVPTGGMFVAVDLAAEQARFDRREIVSTGPIFGRKMFSAAAVAAEREKATLDEAGLEPRHFFGFGKLLSGTRRGAVVYPENCQAETAPEGVRLRFTLPAGCYATILLREFMKTSLLDGDETA
jgi:tRNA pseudouridine13 synthase